MKLVAFLVKLFNDFRVKKITHTCTDYQNASFLKKHFLKLSQQMSQQLHTMKPTRH